MIRFLLFFFLLIPCVVLGANLGGYDNLSTVAGSDEFIFWDVSEPADVKTKNITLDNLFAQIAAAYGLTLGGGGSGQTSDIQAALDGAATPSAANVFATMDDVSAAGGGDMLKSVYDTEPDNLIDAAESLNDGTNSVTAAAAKTHIDDTTKHFLINDTTAAADAVYSSSKVDTLVTGFMVGSNNLSEITAASTARTNLNLGTSATLNTGTTSGTVALGNAPAAAVATHETSYTHGDISHANRTTLDAIPDHSAVTTGYVIKKQADGSLAFEADSNTGTSAFLDMSDTPTDYTDDGGKCVAVNVAENALEFITCGTGGGSTTFTGLTDTPGDLTGQDGLGVFVNSGGTALEFVAGLKAASNLSDVLSAETARSNLDLGNSATLNTGTSAGSVAVGNHLHTTVYEPIASNDFDPDRISGDTTDDNLIDEGVIDAAIARDTELHSAVTIAAGTNAVAISGQELSADSNVEALADTTATSSILGLDASGDLTAYGTGGDLPAVNSVTAGSYNTSASDGGHYFNAANSGSPNTTGWGASEVGNCAYNKTDDNIACWDGTQMVNEVESHESTYDHSLIGSGGGGGGLSNTYDTDTSASPSWGAILDVDPSGPMTITFPDPATGASAPIRLRTWDETNALTLVPYSGDYAFYSNNGTDHGDGYSATVTARSAAHIVFTPVDNDPVDGTIDGYYMELQGATVDTGTDQYASSNTDIVFYANLDTTGTDPQKGTAGSLTFDGGLLDTSTPITGAGSWDNNNTGWDDITVASSEIDFDDAVIGFYWRPHENGSGRIVGSTGSGFKLSYQSATNWAFDYKDQTGNILTHNLDSVADNFNGTNAHFIEIILTGSTAKVYINNSQIGGTITGATGSVSGNLQFGASDGNQFDARYDQILISNDSATPRDFYAIRNNTNFD